MSTFHERIEFVRWMGFLVILCVFLAAMTVTAINDALERRQRERDQARQQEQYDRDRAREQEQYDRKLREFRAGLDRKYPHTRRDRDE